MNKRKIMFFSIIITFLISGSAAVVATNGSGEKTIKYAIPSSEEKLLHRLINEYRSSRGLPAIRLSKSLTNVAKIHAYDLNNNPPNRNRGCNAHSWSKNGPWKSCCYTNDHARAQCMWDKPRDLTNYRGNGYECAFWSSLKANARGALSSWKTSPGHNAVIISSGMWGRAPWNSIGVGIHGKYAVIWFGRETDPDGYWE